MQEPRFLEFTDEDWTLDVVCLRVVVVAEVGERRLAQTSVIRIHSNRVPRLRGRGLARRQASSEYPLTTAREWDGKRG